MKRSPQVVAWFLALLAVMSAPAPAQVSAEPWFRGGTFMITAEAAGAAFSDFDRSQARPVSTELGIGDFRRRVSARTSGSLGAWMTYWVRDGIGLRGGVSWVPSSFTVWHDAAAAGALERPEEESERRYASLDIWMAHGAAVVKLPRSFGRVVPYVVVGGGVIRYSASDDASLPPEAREQFAEGGNIDTPAVLLGVGAVIPLQRRNLLLSFELTDHLSRAPLTGGRGEVFELSGVEMQIDPDPSLHRSDDVGLTSHLRLAIGLTLPLRW